MKTLQLIALLLFLKHFSFCQSESERFKIASLNNVAINKTELNSKLQLYDFSAIFSSVNNSVVYGFIGENFQRIRIKFIVVKKDTSSADTYLIYGKSMVKNNINSFKGSIKISNIRRLKHTSLGVDNHLKNKGIKGEFIILGDYIFSEDVKQLHSGIFKGCFLSSFYLDKKLKPHYDDIRNYADGYSNNQFVGKWIEYKTNVSKRCNWGDFRIPNSGDLDIGAGYFSPSKYYLKYGWQTVRDLDIPQKNKKAKKIEEAMWWQ